MASESYFAITVCTGLLLSTCIVQYKGGSSLSRVAVNQGFTIHNITGKGIKQLSPVLVLVLIGLLSQ